MSDIHAGVQRDGFTRKKDILKGMIRDMPIQYVSISISIYTYLSILYIYIYYIYIYIYTYIYIIYVYTYIYIHIYCIHIHMDIHLLRPSASLEGSKLMPISRSRNCWCALWWERMAPETSLRSGKYTYIYIYNYIILYTNVV